jgi:DNA polymerase-3 subunit delta
MRYQTVKSFEGRNAGKSQKFYLILHPVDLERNELVRKVVSSLDPSPGAITFLKGSDTSCQEIISLLNSPNLFGSDPIVIVEEIDELEKIELEILDAFIQQGNPFGFLIGSSKSKLSINSSFDKGGIVLDLLDEKPWDKEKRCMELIFTQAAKGNKRLSPDAANLLMERIGADPFLIVSEIDKLICYVGDRSQIDSSDILKISAQSKEETIWQIAEEIVWEKGNPKHIELLSIHALIPALRQQLAIGLKINELQGTPRDQWSSFLPKMWPKTLEKRSSQAIYLGKSYFQKGLSLLFKLELLTRTGSTQEEALIDLFRTQLHTP